MRPRSRPLQSPKTSDVFSGFPGHWPERVATHEPRAARGVEVAAVEARERPVRHARVEDAEVAAGRGGVERRGLRERDPRGVRVDRVERAARRPEERVVDERHADGVERDAEPPEGADERRVERRLARERGLGAEERPRVAPVSKKPLQLRFNVTLYESMRAIFVSRSRELVQR